jgi:hypothetical protein
MSTGFRLLLLAASLASAERWATGQAVEPKLFDLSKRVIYSENEAFIVLPPQQVVPPAITRVHMSPNRQAAIVERTERKYPTTLSYGLFHGTVEPPPRVCLYWWDAASGEARLFWSGAREESPGEVWWFPDRSSALFLVMDSLPVKGTDQHRQRLLRMESRLDKPELVAETSVTSTKDRVRYDAIEVLGVSPVLPLGVAAVSELEDVVVRRADAHTIESTTSTLKTSLHLFGPIGRFGAKVDLPGERWSSHGSDVNGQPFIEIRNDMDPGGGTRWYSINTTTGASKLLQQPPALLSRTAVTTEETLGPLRLVPDSVPAGNEDKPSLSLSLRKSNRRVELANQWTDAWLMGGSRGVLFLNCAGLWYVPIYRVSREELRALRSSH